MLRISSRSCTLSALLTVLLATPGIAQASPATSPSLLLAPAIGSAWGGGNQFLDLSLAGAIRSRRLEWRAQVGVLAFTGGCDAVVPTRCGDGQGAWVEGAVLLRIPSGSGVGGWLLGGGAGLADGAGTAFVSATAGRDIRVGRARSLRVEAYGRRLFDGTYRDTWGSHHWQGGVRIGVGFGHLD